MYVPVFVVIVTAWLIPEIDTAPVCEVETSFGQDQLHVTLVSLALLHETEAVEAVVVVVPLTVPPHGGLGPNPNNVYQFSFAGKLQFPEFGISSWTFWLAFP